VDPADDWVDPVTNITHGTVPNFPNFDIASNHFPGISHAFSTELYVI